MCLGFENCSIKAGILVDGVAPDVESIRYHRQTRVLLMTTFVLKPQNRTHFETSPQTGGPSYLPMEAFQNPPLPHYHPYNYQIITHIILIISLLRVGRMWR